MLMHEKEILDLYTDYLISSFGLTTGTGLSDLLEGALSHDRLQRFLASPAKGGKDLWQVVKPYVCEVESEAGVLIVDDSISEKPVPQKNLIGEETSQKSPESTARIDAFCIV